MTSMTSLAKLEQDGRRMHPTGVPYVYKDMEGSIEMKDALFGYTLYPTFQVFDSSADAGIGIRPSNTKKVNSGRFETDLLVIPPSGTSGPTVAFW